MMNEPPDSQPDERLLSEVLLRAGFSDSLDPHALSDAPSPINQAARALVVELWALRNRESPAWQAELGAANRLGVLLAQRDEDATQSLRHTLALGRTLIETAVGAGALSGEEAARLALVADEAAARVAGARERALARRRDEWLAFLSHQLKNPLNTITTTVWLLRHGPDTSVIERLGPIERAIDRLLLLIKDVRELAQRSREPVPDGFASRFITPSPGSEPPSKT